MRSRVLLLGLGLLGAALPGGASAQSEVRYPDGLVIQPLPVVPGLYPGGGIILNAPASRSTYSMPAPNIDVNVTGSPVPHTMTISPGQVAADRRGCDVQPYAFGSRTVRVRRC